MAAKAAKKRRAGITKMHLLGYDGAPPSNVREREDGRLTKLFGNAGALEPPYSPTGLGMLVEQSNIIPQCIRSYVVNCDLFGHKLVPIIDMAAEDADKQIADVIYLERLDEAEATGKDVPDPTEEEIKARRETIEKEMRKEKALCEVFFSHCTHGYAFEELRARMRNDKLTNGNSFAEVIRNKLGRIVELKHVPSFTIRMLPLGKWMEVDIKVRISPITFKTEKKWCRFRRYVQICEGNTTYFKEFGDVRVMSADTGEFFTEKPTREENLAAMKAKEPNGREATELWADCVYSASGPYGIPIWAGNLLSVKGSRSMEYVNVLFFDNKSIPPLAVMIEGGRLAKQSIDAFKKFIEDKAKGINNFHKAIVLEAIPAEGQTGTATADGKIRIKIQPLTDAIMKDAMFMEYDSRNRDKVGESFRLPKILRGDSSEVNRATADAALGFAEQQVFAPERNATDYLIDRTILTDMDVRYFTFESLGPDLKNAEALANAAKQFENTLNRNEMREIASDVFGREYKPVDGGDVPFAMEMAGAGSGGLGLMGDIAGANDAQKAGDAVALARHLIKIRKAVMAAEGHQASKEFAAAKRDQDGAAADDAVVVHVPAGELESFIDRDRE